MHYFSNCEKNILQRNKMSNTGSPSLESEYRFVSTPEYLKRNVFPTLKQALKKNLELIKDDDFSRNIQRRLVFGLDLLSEDLWNLNSKNKNLDLFLMPKVKRILQEYSRPVFPKFMTLSKEEAAIKIQALTRGYLVRKQTDVFEMRRFWEEMRGRKIPLKKTCFAD